MKKSSLICLTTIGLFALQGLLQSCDNEDSPDILTHEISSINVAPTNVLKSEAINVAHNFSRLGKGRENSTESRSTATVGYLNNRLGELVAYVVNTPGEGWVIVSSTRNTVPVLAYSDDPSSTFLVTSDLHEGILMWLDEITPAVTGRTTATDEQSAQISAEWESLSSEATAIASTGLPTGNSPQAIACRNRLKELNETYYSDGWSFTTLSNVSGVTMPSSVFSLADQYDSPYEYTIVGLKADPSSVNVGPLIQTRWHQEADFNKLCPHQYLAGCVAVAMAQIMNYHRHPSTYDWTKMDYYTATEECQRLIADIGQAVQMGYGPNLSGASPENTEEGFKAFGYQAELKDLKREEVEQEIIYNRHPVYSRGNNPIYGYGHAWICDGVIRNKDHHFYYVEYINSVNEYSNKGETFIYNPGSIGESLYPQYHMNWGWNDESTVGWYTSLSPSESEFTTNRQSIIVSPER